MLKPALRDPTNLAAALGYYPGAALSGAGVDPYAGDLQAASFLTPDAADPLRARGDRRLHRRRGRPDRRPAERRITLRVEIVDGGGHFRPP